MRARQARDLLGERHPPACCRSAAEPADQQIYLDPGPRDRCIHQQPAVTPVDVPGDRAAVWALPMGGPGMDP